MIKFEEDLNKKMDLKEVPMYFTQSGCSMTRKTYIETNWVFDTYKNWHSDEEFQEMKESYWNQAESILSMLDEIKSLKSQLQQQALPVVPECVEKWYKFHIDGTFSAVVSAYAFNEADEEVIWIAKNGGMALLCKMYLYGYTVEKTQLFYLENKLTGAYLYYDEVTKLYSDIVGNVEDFFGTKTKFTQQEIDSMQTGSYKQIEVEE